MNSPIKPGTARRLGIRRPQLLIITIRSDFTAFREAMDGMMRQVANFARRPKEGA